MTDISLLSGLRNGSWLDRQDFPPLRYAVPGVIPEGSTLLVGAPKIGKSWLVLACALAKASGGIALSAISVDASPVLYLALEDGDRRMQTRCRTLLGGGPIPAAFEYLTRVEPGRVLETITAWLARHPGAAPFVILDTLGKVMPPALTGESPYQRDYRIASGLKHLADSEPGSAVLVNHHDRKASADDFIDSVSGTHGLVGAADTTIVLVRPRNESDGLIKITGRDVPEAEYAVRFAHGSTWQLNGLDLDEAARVAQSRALTAGLGDRSADIVAYVNAQTDPVTPAALADALGIDNDDAGKYLRRLSDSHRILKVGRGLYAPVRSVRTSETQPDEPPNFGHSDTSDAPTDRQPGNPRCTVCGKPNLFHPLSIARGVCAACAKHQAPS
jgi:AAA domain